MPKVRTDVENVIRRQIRDAIAVDPLISINALTKVVSKRLNRDIDPEYVKKLLSKIDKEKTVALDRGTIEKKIIQLQEAFRSAGEKLLRIAHWSYDEKQPWDKGPSYKDQIAALRAFAYLQKVLFDAELDAGIYKRHIGNLEIERRNLPLPPEVENQILKSLYAWGVQMDFAEVEQGPRVIEVKQIENGGTEILTNESGNTATPISNKPLERSTS